jgi:hypothetical protein
MQYQAKFQKSLGVLRINNKTKEKSPDLIGTMKIHRSLITVLWKELNNSGGEEVTCNIAAWQYHDKKGALLNVELSERYEARQNGSQPRQENIFDLIAAQQYEETG